MGRVPCGDTLELGAYAGAVLYLRNLYDKPLRLGGVLGVYQAAAASLGKLAVLLAIKPTVVEPARPLPLPALCGHSAGRQLRYEDVSFAYGNGPEVLRGLMLDIPARPGRRSR
ncbi:putative protein OS=Streptomyces aurantiogriseus OX=66870 GN=GCM10010251_93790 PE=4 SV=1 [Streptomyces aurantiogriseus]|uniref:Uncharacterized protein n=1 Tax=Streptomyces aurantiogriseus TaxID=66870 RepID=A0A918FP43_9ACTN|nr:hypothetical protein GCM10010251_93790 [Streptomyces aurantiogriseus]